MFFRLHVIKTFKLINFNVFLISIRIILVPTTRIEANYDNDSLILIQCFLRKREFLCVASQVRLKERKKKTFSYCE